MRIAIVGAGIAGLAAARSLSGRHELHVFDAAPRAGGHALTAEVEEGGRRFPVDIGFIVYNRRNYPGFCALLDELEVETVESSMGFSASDPSTGFEYSGESVSALLARRWNLIDPRFWGIAAGAWRFYKEGTRELAAGRRRSLAEFASASRLPRSFVHLYLLPMAGAIWSMPRERVLDFPAATLLNFFRQHGLLDLLDRPQWRTVRGGSRSYVDALTGRLDATFHLGAPVRSIRRLDPGVPGGPGVEIVAGGETLRFDQAVLALHSDQALAALADPTPAEREVLGAIRYRESDVVLHGDASLLPRRRRAWASWNVRLDSAESLGVTYLMNLLQPLPTETPWCVTLNRTAEIDPSRLVRREAMAHPQFDAAAVAAQQRWEEISGWNSIHYCGAYWRHGFHEDGLWSGRRAAESVVQVAARVA